MLPSRAAINHISESYSGNAADAKILIAITMHSVAISVNVLFDAFLINYFSSILYQ